MNEEHLQKLWEQAEIPQHVSIPERVNYRHQTMSHLGLFKKTIIAEIVLGILIFVIAILVPMKPVTKIFVTTVSISGLGLSLYGFVMLKKIVHTDSTHLFLGNVIETLRAFSKKFMIFSSLVVLGAIIFFLQIEGTVSLTRLLFSISVGFTVELLLYVYYRMFYKKNILRLETVKKTLEGKVL